MKTLILLVVGLLGSASMAARPDLVAQVKAGTPLETGLARYYPFDEPVSVTATGDLYFVGADNYTTPGTSLAEPAKFGKALVGTGEKGTKGGYLRSVDNSREWQPGTGDFTCSVWARGASSGACDIISRGARDEPHDPLGRTGWALARTADGAVVLSLGTSADKDAKLQALTSASHPFADHSRFVHLAWTRQGDVVTLYVDGKAEQVSRGWKDRNIGVTSKVWYRELRTNPARGNGNMRAGDAIDDLAFWTRALPADDVAQLAKGDRPLAAFLPTDCATGYARGTDKSPIDYTHDLAFMRKYRQAAIAIAERKREGRRLMPTGGGFSGFFVWDTVFGVLWGLHAPEMHFPLTESLDNFYRLQDEDGFICREYTREGYPCWDKRHPWSYNPPILAWGEVALFRAKVSDTARLAKVYPHLVKFHQCYQRTLRRADGLYFSDILGCGMDDLPRWPFGLTVNDLPKGGIQATRDMVGERLKSRFWDHGWLPGIAKKHGWNRQAGWIDMSAQMAFDCLNLAEIATAIGKTDEAKRWQKEHDELAALINAKCWDEKLGFYFDRTDDGIIPRFTAAAFWVLLARIPSEAQLDRLVKVFDDPQYFGTCVPVTTMAAASPDYRANGYWPGQVWPPTTYMTIEGLRAYGRHKLAERLARAWYNSNAQLFVNHGTVFENISPHFGVRGTGGRDFCGWGALAPVAVPSVFGWLAEPQPGNLIAHKGNTGLKNFRENTVAAAHEAVTKGFAFENDVQISKNGVLYLSHDRTKRDYPSDWSDTFEETIKMMPTGSVYKIDAKCGLAGLDRLVAAAKRDHTSARALLVFNTNDRKFSDRIHAELPGAQVWLSLNLPRRKSYNCAKEAEQIIRKCREVRAEGISLRWEDKLCTEEFFKILREAHITIDVWTVDDAETAKEAIRRGARYVTTNRPMPIVEEWKKH